MADINAILAAACFAGTTVISAVQWMRWRGAAESLNDTVSLYSRTLQITEQKRERLERAYQYANAFDRHRDASRTLTVLGDVFEDLQKARRKRSHVADEIDRLIKLMERSEVRMKEHEAPAPPGVCGPNPNINYGNHNLWASMPKSRPSDGPFMPCPDVTEA